MSVAPRVGAWIEILIAKAYIPVTQVAPRVGAWIEIQQKAKVEKYLKGVAPRVGAWIEICVLTGYCIDDDMSLPAWERGLKSDIEINTKWTITSLPAWERGLKFF